MHDTCKLAKYIPSYTAIKRTISKRSTLERKLFQTRRVQRVFYEIEGKDYLKNRYDKLKPQCRYYTLTIVTDEFHNFVNSTKQNISIDRNI